jgi:hypothetical protein
MSFSLSFNARSRSNALAVLEVRKSSVPAAVHAFLKTAIENIGPVDGQELRLIEVAANGHLCEDKSSFAASSGTLKVQPHYAPD